VMDWRGTERAVAFTRYGKVGGRIPLSGGWRLTRSREGFELHRDAPPRDAEPLRRGLDWDGWRFDATARRGNELNAWVALLNGSDLKVRAWQPADRMRTGGLNRRVKRFLSDAGITGEPRARWPVVLAGEEIVWIPGVGRSDAAAVRPGRPGTLFRCDYDRR
jgi:tRNA(Ile)-lysidine synthetase-like protein